MTALRKTSGIVLAVAAASLFAAGAVTLSPTPAMADGVKCVGINACAGQSECASATNECQGQNECAGQGWVTSESGEACADAGGLVVEG
jgi:hypothetical protein